MKLFKHLATPESRLLFYGHDLSLIIKQTSGIYYCSFSSKCDQGLRRFISGLDLPSLPKDGQLNQSSGDTYNFLNYLADQGIQWVTFLSANRSDNTRQWTLYSLKKQADHTLKLEQKSQKSYLLVQEAVTLAEFFTEEKAKISPAHAVPQEREPDPRPKRKINSSPDTSSFEQLLAAAEAASQSLAAQDPESTPPPAPKHTRTVKGWGHTTESAYAKLQPEKNIFIALNDKFKEGILGKKKMITTFISLFEFPFSGLYNAQDSRAPRLYHEYFEACLTQRSIPVKTLKDWCELVIVNGQLASKPLFFFQQMNVFLEAKIAQNF